ncbi:hypothetical protein LTR28_012740, partial [Elasticomyces elasticus]
MQERILDEEDDGDRDKALRILSLVLCARQPLSLTALQHALAVEPGVAELEEYLDENRDLYFTDPELVMAVTCLAYLSLTPLAKPVGDDAALESRFKQFPLLAYAAQHWGKHVREAKRQDIVNRAARHCLREPSRLEAWSQAVGYAQGIAGSGRIAKGPKRKRTALFEAVERDRGDIVDTLLTNSDLDVNTLQLQYHERTALIVAAKQGYDGIVASLLDDSRTDVSAQDLSRCTALAHAVKEYAIVTDKFAQYKGGVNKLARNEHGKTALELAKVVGH